MKPYLDIVKKIFDVGIKKEDRTGVGTIAIAGCMFEHDMSEGFPLVTTKSVPMRLVASELEFFIKGITDKKWLQDRNNHIWDEWCSPAIIPYAHDDETKEKMMAERDLGPLYGWQWRNFGAKYKGWDKKPIGKGIDQLKKMIHTLKTDPSDRRIICMAWNPVDVDKVLPPFCHYGFQVTVINNRLNLLWNQRSCDVALGLPFNIASYGLMLHLLAKETGFEEGKLVGFIADTHIYLNHVDGLRQQINRKPFPLPNIKTKKFKSIFNWEYTDTEVIDYTHHPRIKFEVAI